MTNLLFALAILLIVAISIIFWATRALKIIKYVLPLGLVLVSSLMYWHWGSYRALQILAQKKQQEQQTQQALKKYKTPAEVIARMEQHLNQKPDSAKGWYLLGRLYQSQAMLDKSAKAFAKAYQLDSNDLKIKLMYMQALYFSQNQKLAGQSKVLLENILAEDPYQLDALSFAATDAYSHAQYALASQYWQKMLKALPEGAQEKQMILKAIATAQLKEKKNDSR